MFSKYKKRILYSVILGAAVFLAFSIYADFDNLMRAFSEFNWIYFPIVLILTYTNFVLRFFKWEFYRKILKIDLEWKLSYMVFMSTFIMSITPGKMGELLKSYLIREEIGTPVSKSAPILIAERLTDFISIVLLCITGAIVFDYGKGIVIGVGVFFTGCVLIISSRNISMKVISFLENRKIFHGIGEKFHTAYESIFLLVKTKPLVIATLISILAWFCECAGFYIVMKVYSNVSHVEVSLLSAVFIYGFSTIIGAIAMLPGGLGVTEASLTGLMILMKIPKDISVASTFIIRVGTLWFAVVVGIVWVYIYQRYSEKRIDKLEMG